jgi:hypothetical protein
MTEYKVFEFLTGDTPLFLEVKMPFLLEDSHHLPMRQWIHTVL